MGGTPGALAVELCFRSLSFHFLFHRANQMSAQRHHPGVDASPPRPPVTSRRPTSNIYKPYFNTSSAPALRSSSHPNTFISDSSVLLWIRRPFFCIACFQLAFQGALSGFMMHR